MYKLILVGKDSLAHSTTIYVEDIQEFLEFLNREEPGHHIQVFNKGNGW